MDARFTSSLGGMQAKTTIKKEQKTILLFTFVQFIKSILVIFWKSLILQCQQYLRYFGVFPKPHFPQTLIDIKQRATAKRQTDRHADGDKHCILSRILLKKDLLEPVRGQEDGVCQHEVIQEYLCYTMKRAEGEGMGRV